MVKPHEYIRDLGEPKQSWKEQSWRTTLPNSKTYQKTIVNKQCGTSVGMDVQMNGTELKLQK